MEGYAKVGQLMANDEEFAILRRFRALNMRMLLYQQAEIMHLDWELSQLVERDASHMGRQFHAKNWWSLSQEGEGEDLEQWQKILEINKKLDLYNDALLKQASLANLEQPREYDLGFLRNWLRRPSMGAFPLLGSDREAWDAHFEDDLIALSPRSSTDIFSRWFTERWLPWYHQLFGKRLQDSTCRNGNISLQESSIESCLSILGTVVASLLPISSVVILYAIQSNKTRLGVVVVFSACFSLALTLMTNARRIEVFAATAAYAAVNVAFLTDNSSSGR